MNNPYVWKSINIDLFYGRQELLEEMLQGLPLNPRHSYGISGGRRMGKTTLLRRVQKEVETYIPGWHSGGLRVIPLYVDGLALPRPLQYSDVWIHILRELKKSLPEHSVNIPPRIDDLDSFRRVLASVIDQISLAPRFVVMFDEIEPIAVCEWGEGFFAHWRTLLSNSPGISEYLTAVFAGAHEMALLRYDLGSPLKDILEWYNLLPLSYEESCRLMEEPIEHEWPKSFKEHLYVETGGHPMLIQYLMQNICNAPLEAANQSLEAAIVRFGKLRRWQFGEWWERYCSPLAQRVYTRFPDDGQVVTLRELTREFGSHKTQDALENLLHVGLATEEENGFAYRYVGEMFRRWYRQFGSLKQAELHDIELLSKLSKINKEIGDKYLSGWKIYEAELPNYSGAVGEMRDVLSMILRELAPDKKVLADPNFKLEKGLNVPTRRQRILFLAQQQYQKREQISEIASDFDLVEIESEHPDLFKIESEHLANSATHAYRESSGMAHTTASRERAYRTLKQWESILARLLPVERPVHASI